VKNGPLTFALPKGRLADEAMALMARAGIRVAPPDAGSRRLVFASPESGLSFLLVKPADVPIYVEYGVADLGVAGKDTILESRADVYEVLDLGIGRCRMVVAGPQGTSQEATRRRAFVRVATRYPHIAQQHFLARGCSVEVIGLAGSVELAPVTGLAEQIVDLVQTGGTLAAHHLVELEVLFHSSARLVVNRAAHKLKLDALGPLIDRLSAIVGPAGGGLRRRRCRARTGTGRR
jgi:ATP phosphoribosyltransferase